MPREHKERLLARLDALTKAVEGNDLPDEVLKAVYAELLRLDELFPKGVKTHSILELKGLGKKSGVLSMWTSI